MFKKIILITLTLAPLLSLADTVNLLEVTSESDPRQISSISIVYDNTTHIISTLSYKKDIRKNKIETFPMPSLLKQKQSLHKIMTVDIINLKAIQVDPTRFIVTMSYLYEYGFKGSIYKDKKLLLSFSTLNNRFQTIDLDTQKTITKMHLFSHYVRGVEKGIDRIETLE